MRARRLLALLFCCVAAETAARGASIPPAGNLFHEGSRVLLTPDKEAAYFGYSVMLRNTTPPQLIVGAPTAMTTHVAHAGLNNTGAVYSCLLDLTLSPENITCSSLEFDTEGNTIKTSGRGLSIHHYKDEMWLGAVLANVDNGSLVMCAPRWANQVEMKRASHRLVNGLCYVVSPTRAGILVPLANLDYQAFINTYRTEYGPRGTYLNNFAYGQAGFSAKISSDSTTLLLGAPGLLQWTGGVARYTISFSADRGSDFFTKQPVVNPYFTKELGPDSYFGYAVDMGVFEAGGALLGVGGAPRGREGLGEVLIFELKGGESSPMSVKALLTGSQLGAYFGGVLLVMDVNSDGLADLLVAAPLHADRGVEGMPYDQGVVYVYLNRPMESGFTFELVSTLTGSGAIGARFGSALADLGDVDDGDTASYPEIAIGAPWESDGRGAVYVYRCGADGVNSAYAQRLSAEYKGFGYSVTGGLDVDGNGCNDLVVGALNSDVALVYRCSRAVHVTAEIRVPGAFDLPENATDFLADFCIVASATRLAMHPRSGPVAIDLIGSVTVDAGGGRAALTGDAEYTERNVEPGRTYCKQQTIVIHRKADLTRPITLTFDVKAATDFPPSGRTLGAGTRLGSEAPSRLSTSVDIQVTRDCGEDLVCQPILSLHVDSLGSSQFVPGLDERLGATVTVVNAGEPAYSACLKITVPKSLLRVPSDCRLRGMELTCDLPRPFYRGSEANWTVEMDAPSATMEEYDLEMKFRLYESCVGHVEAKVEELITIRVVPEANITTIGHPLPNATLPISREKFAKGGYIEFGHFFAITNYGPSDLPALIIEFSLPSEVSLVEEVTGCARTPAGAGGPRLTCTWAVRARRQTTALLLLRLDLQKRGELLQQQTTLNITTEIRIPYDNQSLSVTSCLSLEAAPPLWPAIVAALLGLLLVAAIAFGLYKCGFFGREQRARLQRLREEVAMRMRSGAPPGSMSDVLLDDDADAGADAGADAALSREPSPLSDFYAVG